MIKKYRFKFCGVDNSDALIEKSDLDRVKEGVLSWKEYRAKYNLPSTIESDDFLMNSTWVQIKQMQAQAQAAAAPAPGMPGMEGGAPPSDDDNFANMVNEQRKLRENEEEKPEDNIFKELTTENPFVRDLNTFVEKAFPN